MEMKYDGLVVKRIPVTTSNILASTPCGGAFVMNWMVGGVCVSEKEDGSTGISCTDYRNPRFEQTVANDEGETAGDIFCD